MDTYKQDNVRNLRQINIADQVLSKIENRKIKIRPHWQFVAEKIGLESGILFALVVAIIACSWLMHYWQVNELHQIIGFGPKGIWHIALYFPYELLAAAVIALVAVNRLIKFFDWGYRRSWLVWIGSSLAMLLITTCAILALGINEQLARLSAENNLPILNPIYHQRLSNIKNDIISAQLDEVDAATFKAHQLKNGSSSFVILRKNIRTKINPDKFHSGDKVRLIGSHAHGQFEAWGIDRD